MNFKKSRFAATLTVALMVCMMVAMMVVPASAAVIEEQAYYYEMEYDVETTKSIHSLLCGCNDQEGVEIGQVSGFAFNNGQFLATADSTFSNFEGCNFNFALLTSWEYDGEVYYELPMLGNYIYSDPDQIVIMTRTGPDETEPPVTPPGSDGSDLGISEVVTPELFDTVLDEIVALLPVAIPVMIGFIGLRKGISFLQSVLHSA